MDIRRVVVLAALVFVIPGTARANLINFEALGDLESVTVQFPGLTFSGATTLTAGISLTEAENPPHSGSVVVFDDGGPLSIAFATPVFDVGGYFTYTTQLTLQAFDSSNNLVASTLSAFANNQQLSGQAGSSPNEFISLAFAGGISSLLISGGVTGETFVLDDLTFDEQVSAPIPEPASLTLLLLGGAAAAVRKRLTRRS